MSIRIGEEGKALLFVANFKKFVVTDCKLKTVFLVPRSVEMEHEIEFGPEVFAVSHEFDAHECQSVPELLRVSVFREMNILPPKPSDFLVMVADGKLECRQQGGKLADEGCDLFSLVVCGALDISAHTDRGVRAQWREVQSSLP